MKFIAKCTPDGLGRIVIPLELRTNLGLDQSNKVNIYLSGDRIILKKAVPCCKLCKSEENVNTTVELCQNCIDKIKQI